MLFFVLGNLQVQEKFKQVAGGEYIGFSNATWVICLSNSKIVLTVKFFYLIIVVKLAHLHRSVNVYFLLQRILLFS